jgi:hypothetical protein
VNVRSTTDETGSRQQQGTGREGVSMSDQSGVVLPGSREEMRLLRKNSNWVNMTVAIMACLALVGGVLLLAPQPEVNSERVVDYRAIAEASQANTDYPLVVPDVPSGWTSNEANLDRIGDTGVTSWYVSFLGPDDQWVSIEQAQASQAWADGRVQDATAAETVDVSGYTYQVYRTDDAKVQWVTSKGDVFVVITAIATPDTVNYFADQVSADLA